VIVLYRTAGPSQLADRVEESLRDLVVAHSVRVVAARDVPGGQAPTIVDGDRRVLPSQLDAYLEQLRVVVAQWNRFQGDSCYLNDDGTVC
jgi:hypothetical protein